MKMRTRGWDLTAIRNSRFCTYFVWEADQIVTCISTVSRRKLRQGLLGWGMETSRGDLVHSLNSFIYMRVVY
jgi:hypothetical protein